METNGERNPNPDQETGSGYGRPENPDGFVTIDVESFAPLPSSNSRFSLQRSLSRKGSGLRSNNDRKIHYDANGNDKEASILPQSPLRGSGTPENSAAVGAPVGPTDVIAVGPPLHQITITTTAAAAAPTTAGNISDKTERRFGFSRKTSFKRSPTSWILDPKKVVLFFATLSSMGSILLIIFTLSMSKSSPEDVALHH